MNPQPRCTNSIDTPKSLIDTILRDPQAEQANMNMLQAWREPNTSEVQRQDMGKDEEINEH